MLLLAQFSLPDLLLPLAVLIAIFILIRRSRRYFRRSRNESAIVHVPRQESNRNGSASGSARISSDELIRQEVEFYERCRDMSGMLDSKIRVLQHLVTQSQQQIDRLEALNTPAGTSALATESSASESTAPTAPDDPQRAETPQFAEIIALAEKGFSIATIAHRVGLPLNDVESILNER